eukprot:1567298-Pleurochrysis_carterae.AAC.2
MRPASLVPRARERRQCRASTATCLDLPRWRWRQHRARCEGSCAWRRANYLRRAESVTVSEIDVQGRLSVLRLSAVSLSGCLLRLTPPVSAYCTRLLRGGGEGVIGLWRPAVAPLQDHPRELRSLPVPSTELVPLHVNQILTRPHHGVYEGARERGERRLRILTYPASSEHY